MTTAQLRTVANSHASNCHYGDAAAAMRAAISIYPGIGPDREPSAMQRRDIGLMWDRAASWESFRDQA